MKNISFFAWPAHYYRRGTISNRTPHLFRGSSLIRGNQTSEYMGAKLNPEQGYENDVCIYVKPYELEGIKDGSYIDILDGVEFIRKLVHYPNLKIITISETGRDYLRVSGLKNEIAIIPQHHCNIENFVRDRKEITTVGVIGSVDSFDYPVEEFREQMGAVGLKFVTNYSFKDREEIIDFYRQMDIQVSWNTHSTAQKLLRDSLRIKNAASFGIPTVAYPEANYKEFEGDYIRVNDMESLIAEVVKLKDKGYYQQWSEKAIRRAKDFHISKIAEIYRQLS